MTAKQLINHSLPFLRLSDSVDEALTLFNEYKLNGLPLVEDQKLLGLYSEDLILNYDLDFTLSDIQPICQEKYIFEDDPLLEAINKSFQCDLELLPVIDSEENYIGSILKIDLYKNFIESLSLHEKGSLLEIHVNKDNYLLSDISRIIESESARIISLYVTPTDTDNLILSIKLDVTQISSVISALTRYGYDIISYYSSEPVTNMDKERFEQLMKYLSI